MTRKPRPQGVSTVAVHGGSEQAETPIRRSSRRSIRASTSSRRSAPPRGSAILVTATRRTPRSWQRRIAMLEGAEAAIVLASGMGATACALLALLRPGDHLLASSWVYGGTHRLFTQEFEAMGIGVTLVDPTESRGWRRRLQKGDACDLRRDAGEPDVPGARPARRESPHERKRPRAGRRLHVRESGELSPARTRSRRRHPFGNEVPQRSSRRALGCRRGHGAVHRGSSTEDDGVGPGAGSICGVVARPRSQDTRCARSPAERERGCGLPRGRTGGKRSARCITRGFRITRITKSRARPSTDSAG